MKNAIERRLEALTLASLESVSSQVASQHLCLLAEHLQRIQERVDQLAGQNAAVDAPGRMLKDQLKSFSEMLALHLTQEHESVLALASSVEGDDRSDAGKPELRAAVDRLRHDHHRLQEALSGLQLTAETFVDRFPGPLGRKLLIELAEAGTALDEQILEENRVLFPRATGRGSGATNDLLWEKQL